MEDRSPAQSTRADRLNPAVRSSRVGSFLGRVLIWILVALVFAGLFALVLSHHNQATAQTGRSAALAGLTVTVVPVTAARGDIGVYQESIGTVTPVYTSSITSQVTGVVMAVHYREGQTVHKGDPLVDIDPRPFQANLVQAQGTLAKDTHVLAQARMDLERYQTAWAGNAIAKQTVDDQEKLVLQDEGAVKADQGQVEYDQVQLIYCHITAPFKGRVGLRLIDPGNIVQANGTTPLVVVTQEHPITVIFTVAEDALPQIRAGLRHGATLRVDAYDRTALTKIASGKLLSLDNQIDTTTGTLKLRAIFNNKDGALFPNQFVNARLLVKMLKGVTLIPTSAIQHNGQTAFVYVIQNGTAQVRNIKPGVTDGNVTAVEGIAAGDVVANSSFEKLQPNAKVALAKGATPAGGNGSSAP